MTPEHTIPAYGLPCERCTRPARHVEVYPRGRRVIHIDSRLRHCDLVNQPHTTARERTT